MVYKIINQKPMNLAEVKDELEKIKKKIGELGFRANKTDEYLQQMCSLKPEQAKQLYDKLTKLNLARLKEQSIHKIIDILPTTIDEVKTILPDTTLKKEDLKKIADAVLEFVK